MSQVKRLLPGRRLWRWLLLTSPVVSIIVLQAYIFVLGRPYVWGKVRKSELACLIRGPMTPFGRAMFIGGLPRSHGGLSPVRATRVGVFFLDPMMEILHDGFGFEPDGELYIRLGKGRIWTIDPWTGDVQFLGEIIPQDPLSEGNFPSNEFCVAGNTIWFETFDREYYDTLFLQEGATTIAVFRRGDLFDILGCTADTAYVAWDDNKKSGAFTVSRKDGAPVVVASCGYLDCFFDKGDWEPGRIVYLKVHGAQSWFHLIIAGSDEKLVDTGKRYCALFGCDSVFFLTYTGYNEGVATQIEEMDYLTRSFIQSFWVNGDVELLAERCPS